MTDATTTSPASSLDAEFDRDAAYARHLSALRETAAEPVPHYVAGERSFEGPLIEREDPSRRNVVASACHDAPDEVVERAVAAARVALPDWSALGGRERAAILRGALELLTPDRLAKMAATITLEVGKIRTEAFFEVDELVVLLRMYSDVVDDPELFRTPLTQGLPGVTTTSELRPYGVFGVISPFNHPMVLAAGPTLAALLAGNTVVVKPSHLGPQSMSLLTDLLDEIGLPSGVFNVVYGADDPGKALVAADIDGVAFTGSVPAGQAIQRAMISGAYSRPVIAELGGKNPAIVTDGADVAVAARAIVKSAFTLSAQRCNGLERVIATEGVHDELVREIVAVTEELRIGDPAESETYTGPVVERRSFERFNDAVSEARADGEIVVGGSSDDSTGYFVHPTVVTNLPHGHRLTREELFVPFFTVTKVASLDEAIDEANATEFGLAAGIFTDDRAEAEAFLARVEAGCLNINNPFGATTGFWPGNQTFGGWKASGSTGKLAFGRWYVHQFAREQCRNVASDLNL